MNDSRDYMNDSCDLNQRFMRPISKIHATYTKDSFYIPRSLDGISIIQETLIKYAHQTFIKTQVCACFVHGHHQPSSQVVFQGIARNSEKSREKRKMDLELRSSSFLRNSSRRARSLARSAMIFNSDAIRCCGMNVLEET